MDTLRIKGYEGAALLELSNPEPDDLQQPLHGFVATFTDAGLQARALVYMHPDSDARYLAALFDDLATNWRGWSGTKSWSSLDGELNLDSTHDGLGHISVSIELHPELDPARWYVRAGLVIAAGALDEVASSARRFLRM